MARLRLRRKPALLTSAVLVPLTGAGRAVQSVRDSATASGSDSGTIFGKYTDRRTAEEAWSKLVTVRIVALICAGILPSAFCQDAHLSREESRAMVTPVLPFYDWGACPYDGCAYRQWTAHRSVTVYDTWKQGRQPVGQLAVGDKVIGITGVVITFKPGLIRMDRDLLDGDLRRGDTILTNAYRGEGFSAVWFKGTYRSDFDISFAKWPDGTGCGGAHCAATHVDLGRKSWWAEAKLESGRTGWVEMDLAQIPVSLF